MVGNLTRWPDHRSHSTKPCQPRLPWVGPATPKWADSLNRAIGVVTGAVAYQAEGNTGEAEFQC